MSGHYPIHICNACDKIKAGKYRADFNHGYIQKTSTGFVVWHYDTWILEIKNDKVVLGGGYSMTDSRFINTILSEFGFNKNRVRIKNGVLGWMFGHDYEKNM